MQIDFATETFFCAWGVGGGGGWGLRNNVSQILATVNFSSGEIDRKFLPVWKNFIGNINLGQASRLNLDISGISNDIPDYRSALFAYTLGLLVWANPTLHDFYGLPDVMENSTHEYSSISNIQSCSTLPDFLTA